MSEPNQSNSAIQQNKNHRPKAQTAPAPKPAEVELGLTQQPADLLGTQVGDGRKPIQTALLHGPKGVFGSGAVEAQAARLHDPRLATVQRQALAAKIGRVQGNQHLQRVLSSTLPKYQNTKQTDHTTNNKKQIEPIIRVQGIAPFAIYRQEHTGQESEQATPRLLSEDELSQIIQRTLLEYESIQVQVPLSNGERTPVFIKPVYWIRPDSPPREVDADVEREIHTAIEEERARQSFSEEQARSIETTRLRRARRSRAEFESHHRAVDTVGGIGRIRNGKATPEQLRAFIQQAVDRAAGRHQSGLPQPGDTAAEWQTNIQNWVRESRIGIDCSMFVFQALYNVHAQSGGPEAATQWEGQFQDQNNNVVRPGARALAGYDGRAEATEITVPTNLRVGDLMRTPGHIRIIMIIHPVEGDSIRFKTAESGSSTGARGSGGGPATREWKASVSSFEGLQVLRESGWDSPREHEFNFWRRDDTPIAPEQPTQNSVSRKHDNVPAKPHNINVIQHQVAAGPEAGEGICPVCGRRGRGRCAGCGQKFVPPGQKMTSVQRQTAIGPTTLSTTPAGSISPLGRANMRRFNALLSSGNQQQQVLEFVLQVMTQRGEVDSQLLATQAVPGHRESDCHNASLLIIDSSVNGANAISCGCTGTTGNRLPNSRIRVNFGLMQTKALNRPDRTQSFNDFLAALIHSTLFHEIRHVRQEFELCQGGGSQSSPGVCTDCNSPAEMDAYLAEVEAGYNPHIYRQAWVRVYTNWDYLSPGQQSIFVGRRTAAEQKINQTFPNVNWATDPEVIRYQNKCQQFDQQAGGQTRGSCDSGLAPIGGLPRASSPVGDFFGPPEDVRMA